MRAGSMTQRCSHGKHNYVSDAATKSTQQGQHTLRHSHPSSPPAPAPAAREVAAEREMLLPMTDSDHDRY